jgi:hypothetical protein
MGIIEDLIKQKHDELESLERRKNGIMHKLNCLLQKDKEHFAFSTIRHQLLDHLNADMPRTMGRGSESFRARRKIKLENRYNIMKEFDESFNYIEQDHYFIVTKPTN